MDGNVLAGIYIGSVNTIWIQISESPNMELSTLLHETAHFLTPVDISNESDRQIFAEAVACMTLAEFGLNTKPASFAYFYSQENPFDLSISILQRRERDLEAIVNQLVAGIQHEQAKE